MTRVRRIGAWTSERASIAFAAFGLLMSAATLQTTPQTSSRLDTYLARVIQLTAEERRQLDAGQPVTRLLPTDASKEVSVFGAIWISAPTQRYVDAVTDIENFERGGGFRITKRISTPPRLEDFAALELPEEDLEDLRTCRVGNCALKLGEEALERFRKEIDWKSPSANAAANELNRRIALEYVSRYLEGGNSALAVYRDASRPTFTAQEFRAMIDQMPELTTFMPSVRRYLLEFPAFTLPDSSSLLYWQETKFGLKPTIRISHLVIQQSGNDAVVASKMLYASHYFWTGLELRVLVSDASRGPGLWFVTVNRSRSDGLSGFIGTVVRGRVRSEVQAGTLAALQSTKRMLERTR
jgi:hypothetical protein